MIKTNNIKTIPLGIICKLIRHHQHQTVINHHDVVDMIGNNGDTTRISKQDRLTPGEIRTLEDLGFDQDQPRTMWWMINTYPVVSVVDQYYGSNDPRWVPPSKVGSDVV